MSFADEGRSARSPVEFLFGRPVAFHRCFVKITGSVHAALMLSQALYWLNPERQGQSRGKDDGWFWKSRGEWETELGLSRWEQETARKQLKATNFWREKERRLEHKIYFSVDFVELEKALQAAANPRRTDRLPAPEVEVPPPAKVASPPSGRWGTIRRRGRKTHVRQR
jgi:hypothetical protein